MSPATLKFGLLDSLLDMGDKLGCEWNSVFSPFEYTGLTDFTPPSLENPLIKPSEFLCVLPE